MPLAQRTRVLNLTTPLGDDTLLLTGFTGREGMSQLFSYQLDMISENTSIAPADMVGANVTFSIVLADGSRRFFNGFVKSLSAENEDRAGFRTYRAEVVPWLWFLTRTADCRIFQFKTVPQIIEQIFQDLGLTDYELSLRGNHKQWEYNVQYRETDFNFVSRLMEQEGIFYFFKHEEKKHKLVIADHRGAYLTCPESKVNFPQTSNTGTGEGYILRWSHHYEFRTGKWAQTDFDFTKPSTSLMTNTKSIVSLPNIDKFEVYEFPGEYLEKSDGEAETKFRMEEEEAAYDVVTGSSLCRTFNPGCKFTVGEHHSDSEEDKSYVITAITHSAHEPLHYETGNLQAEFIYENTFHCIPDSVVFRPPRITPQPRVQGVQTAIVVGPGGEEIFTDKYGRVKVHFHWDREGKKDENSSCWIRVAQNWAGKNWGVVFNPRIGQEVIVDFLEGDPDRPIIVGRVYNAEQMPPYALPGEQTKSTIKSRSSKGGGADNFNEIRFEDKMGSEEMYIHAELDQNTVVEHDQSIIVGNDRTEEIGRDRSLDVGRDKKEHVARNKTIYVDGGHTETISQSMTINVASTLTETVAVNYAETVGAAMELTVGLALAITVGAGMAETVGGAKAESIGGSKTETIGQNLSVKTGGFLSENVGKERTVNIVKDLKEKIGGQHVESVDKEYMLNAKKINIVAKDEIMVKVGSAELIMKKNGDITLKGKKINVKGSSDVIIKGSKILEN